MKLTLVRHAYLPDVTLGRLYAADLVLATLEEPWRDDPDGPGGQRRELPLRESCIPDGEYSLVPHTGTKWANVYAVVNPALGVYRWPADIPRGQAWGRSAILIHSGLSVDSILGCILVGRSHGTLPGGKACVQMSAPALDALRMLLGRTSHTLVIRPTAGTSEIAA